MAACGDDITPATDAAPAGLTGLGQICGTATSAACPAIAPHCLRFPADPTIGICSASCIDGGTFTTDAQAALSSVAPDPLGTEAMAACAAAYTGTVGTPSCAVLVTYTPMDAVLQPSASYTGAGFACAIACAADHTCPAGLHCNTAVATPRCEP